jgi:hypothetical protein
MTTSDTVLVSRYVRQPAKTDPWGRVYRGRPTGLVVARVGRQTPDVSFGFSLCHKVDTFDKAVARQYANNVLQDGWITKANEIVHFKASLDNPQSVVDCINNMPQSVRRTAMEMVMGLVRRYWNTQFDNVNEVSWR